MELAMGGIFNSLNEVAGVLPPVSMPNYWWNDGHALGSHAPPSGGHRAVGIER